jgi:hypothetical protein
MITTVNLLVCYSTSASRGPLSKWTAVRNQRAYIPLALPVAREGDGMVRRPIMASGTLALGSVLEYLFLCSQEDVYLYPTRQIVEKILELYLRK